MNVMSGIYVDVIEGQVVGGGSDKFFRTYVEVDGCRTVFQWGRNGTLGTFAPAIPKAQPDAWAPAEHATPAAATAAATAKLASKPDYKRTAAKRLGPFDTFPTPAALDAAFYSTTTGTVTAIEEALAADTEAAVAAFTLRHGALAADHNTTLADIDARLDQRFPHRSAVAGIQTATGRGVVPMLARIAAPGDVDRMLDSGDWVCQRKIDGERVAIEVVDGVVVAYNRDGNTKAKISRDHLAVFTVFTEGRWVFDGEVVGRSLHLFDLVACPGRVSDHDPFVDRYAALQIIVDELALDPEFVAIVPTATTPAEKRAMLQAVVDEQREGLMFRAVTGTYQLGGRSPDLLKLKFVNEADCVVIERVPGKQSVRCGVHDHAGALVDVGPVTIIGKGDIEPGDVIEVRFLYVLDPANPVMVQPRIVRKRDPLEKPANACSIDQFAQAGTRKN